MPDIPTHPSTTNTPDASTSRRAWYAVTTLALAVFAVTVTEMMPVGLLPQISTDLHVSDGAAGQSVTMYGIVAGLSAPVMTSWTRRLDRRSVILAILAVFVVGNVLTALVPTYSALLVIRFALGLFHGLVWSIVATVASRLVSSADAAKATAAVFSGISLALVLGVPSGAALGSWWGWHAAFGVLAGITTLTGAAAYLLIPHLPPQNATQRPTLRPMVTTGGGIRTVLAVTALIVIGNYAAYTYFVPFLIDDRQVSPPSVEVLLIAYGVAGVLGNVAAGAAVSRARSLRTVLFTAATILTASLALLSFAPVHTGITVLSIAVWGMSYSALPVVLQTAVLKIAATAREAATSLYVMVFNVSIAAGSFIGAIGIDTTGATAPILIGTASCCAGACLTILVRTPPNSRRDPAASR